MVAWPEQTHALKLSWILSPLPLLVGRALRAAYRIAPRTMAALDEPLLNARLGRTPRLTLPEGVSLLTELGDDSPFARFWQTLKNEGRLLADRSPAVLRWRLADPDLTVPPLLLAHRRDGVVTGYAMAQMAKANSLEPPVLEIIDLEALAADSEAIPTLMDGLKQAARAMGAAKLRLQTLTPQGLSRLGRHADVTRQEGGWGHCHVKFAPGTPGVETWSPTPFDGDYGICLRPVPMAVPPMGSSPSRGSASARLSLSKPNCEGVPVIRMLVVELEVALLIRSRQSATTPCETATAVSPGASAPSRSCSAAVIRRRTSSVGSDPGAES